MATSLNIIIKATDKASGKIDGVSKSVGGLEKKAGVASRGIGKLGNVLSVGLKAGAVAGAAALAGVGAGLAQAVKLGSDANEMMSKLGVVFPVEGEKLKAAMTEFGAQVGKSKFELMGMATSFGDLLKPMGMTEWQARQAAQEMSILAADLSSFNNMPMDEALRRLSGTLVGSHENALAFGVVINEATLKQELMKMGADELTGAELNLAKVQARMNLLFKGTTDAQGDAARTADGWANQMVKLKDTIKDAATELGLKLLPKITPFLQKVNQLASQYLPLLLNAFDAVINILSEFKVDIGSAFDPIKRLVKPLIDGFTKFFKEHTGIWQGSWAETVEFLSGPMGAQAIERLFLRDIPKWIDSWAWNTKRSIVLWVLGVKQKWMDMKEDTRHKWSEIVNTVKHHVLTMIAVTSKKIEVWATVFIADVGRIWKWVVKYMTDIKDAIIDKWQDILDWWDQHVQPWVDAGKELVKGIWQGIEETWEWLLEQVQRLWRQLGDSFTAYFKIASPSELFANYGASIAQGVAAGIDRESESIRKAAGAMSDGIDSIAAGTFNEAEMKVLAGMGGGVTGALAQLKAFAPSRGGGPDYTINSLADLTRLGLPGVSQLDIALGSKYAMGGSLNDLFKEAYAAYNTPNVTNINFAGSGPTTWGGLGSFTSLLGSIF